MSQLQVTGEAKIRDIQGPVVANSGVITALDGAASQYVRGDGTLADFPTSTGGGSSVSYYLNSSVSQGTIGGVAYRELSKEPIIGAGTDITISANGYVASYITDANDPDVLSVPGGNFNCEFYFSVNNNTGNPTTYAELYKYDGTTFTLLGSSVAVPESLNQGTTIAPYYFAIPVATAALALTDRLAIRIYVSVDGRVVTLHTENSHLCQVVTTFSKGMVSLNNLTDQSQFITTGTSGTNFNIVSSGDTHTFNLPVASATNTGKLSNTDWSTFNAKQPAGNYVTLDTTQTITAAKTFTENPIINGTGTNSAYTILQSAGTNKWRIGNNYAAGVNTFDIFAYDNTTTPLSINSNGAMTLSANVTTTGAQFVQNGFYLTNANGGYLAGYTLMYGKDDGINFALRNGTGGASFIFPSANSYAYTFPAATGTLALTSNLGAYLPLTGGTLTGALNGTTATFSGLGTFNQLTITGATAGRIFYAQTGGVVSQSGNLNWNETNGMLGVGTPNPSAVITAFSTNAATQFKAAGTAPAFTFSESLTTSTYACVFGLATSANHFITGTAAGDMAIANQSATAGAIVFGTGTAEKMRMSASGNFGLGTSNPSSYTNLNTITINGTSGSVIDFKTGEVLYGELYSLANEMRVDAVGASGVLKLLTNSVPRLTIASTGAATFSSSVGVGGSPSGTYGTLSVFGGISTKDDNNGKLEIGRYSSGASNSYIKLGANSNSLRITNNNDTADIFTITNTGNVGIGTSSPNVNGLSTALTINGTSTSGLEINANGVNQGYLIAGTSLMILNARTNIPLLFYTNDTERMRITSAGNVGIGTSSAVYPFVVKVATNRNWAISNSGTGFASFRAGDDGYNNFNRGEIDALPLLLNSQSGGNVLIGTTTDPGYKFSVYGGGAYSAYINQSGGNANFIPLLINHNVTSGTIKLIVFSVGGSTDVGSITTNGSTTSYNTTSDYRLKQDFKDYNALSLISSIKTYDYQWKNDNSRTHGVIAHELAEILPYAVINEKDGVKDDGTIIPQGVDYSKIVPILIKSIQEQQAQIEELKALINK